MSDVKRYTGLLLDTPPHDAPNEDAEYVLASDHERELAIEHGYREAERASHEREVAALRAELENIANAKRFSRDHFDNDTSFADWAQSRARTALQPPSVT